MALSTCLCELPRSVALAPDPPATSTYHLGILSLPLEEYSWQDDIASELLQSTSKGRERLAAEIQKARQPPGVALAELVAEEDGWMAGKCRLSLS